MRRKWVIVHAPDKKKDEQAKLAAVIASLFPLLLPFVSPTLIKPAEGAEDIKITAPIAASETRDIPETTAEAALLSSEKTAEIEAYLEAHVHTGRFSGNVMLTKGDGATLFRSTGLANREHEVANTLETKFRIGSLTKQFTAVAILQLQDQGLLDVQMPVSTYLPDYPEGDRITLHQLLTHTAGIPEYLNPEFFPDIAEWLRLSSTLEQLVARFKDLPLEFEPGDQFKYSNSGYVLLTQVIEIVSGETYSEYIENNIFEPLSMEDTGYEIPQVVIPKLARGYIYQAPEAYLQAEPIDMSIPQGAGGLYSTLEDLATWNAWLHGEATAQSVLSEAALSLLKTPVIPMASEQERATHLYGYGLIHEQHLKRQRIYHNGGIPGFLSVLTYYPEENLTIAVLTNLENTPPERVANDLAAIAFNEPYDLPTEHVAIVLDPALYEKYVGTYQLVPEFQITIRVEDGQLVAQATGQGAFVLSPSSEIDFFAQDYDISLTFTFAEDDTVNGFTFRQAGQEKFAEKT